MSSKFVNNGTLGKFAIWFLFASYFRDAFPCVCCKVYFHGDVTVYTLPRKHDRDNKMNQVYYSSPAYYQGQQRNAIYLFQTLSIYR